MTISSSPQMNFDNKNAYCGWCGTRFLEQTLYPRKCFRCNNDTYLNPIPITVAMIPVWHLNDEGNGQVASLLLQQRNIEPKKGQWSLPGGYLNMGETWQEGCAREVKEEIGIDTDPQWYKLFKVELATNNNLLIFGLCKQLISWDDIHFIPNEESSAIKIVNAPEELAFPTHTAALNDWLYNDE